MSRLNVDQIYTRTGTGTPALREMPAFRGYLSADQSISSSTETKVNIDTVTGEGFFDTNGWFDTTNKRYVPQVAGYYQFNGNIRATGTSPSVQYAAIFKNGAQYEVGEVQRESGLVQVLVSSLVYMNGTTDYAELYGFITATSPLFDYATNSATCFFSGFLVRPD